MAQKRSADEMASEEVDFSTWTEDELHELIQREPPVAVAVIQQALAELERRLELLREYEERLEKGIEDLVREGGAVGSQGSGGTPVTPAQPETQQEEGGEVKEPAGGDEGQEKAEKESGEKK